MLIRCQGPSLVAFAPAKLNLFLEVLGRRPDGFHELETVMVSISLYDSLLFTEDDSQQTRLRCHFASEFQVRPKSRPGSVTDGLGSPSYERDADFATDNLVVRAANLLRQHTGCDRGVTIDLCKRIPMQAGLGGGSSDAAATLVTLNRLWRLGLTSPVLHELAAELGSDVNFFLDSHIAAACTGRGERITPIRTSQRLHAVLVCPNSGLSTGDVFAQLTPDDMAARSMTSFLDTLTSGRLMTQPQALHNRLESPARLLNPDVDRALHALRWAGAASVLMSGSGTSCFALCRSARHAKRLAGRLRHHNIGRVFAVDTRL